MTNVWPRIWFSIVNFRGLNFSWDSIPSILGVNVWYLNKSCSIWIDLGILAFDLVVRIDLAAFAAFTTNFARRSPFLPRLAFRAWRLSTPESARFGGSLCFPKATVWLSPWLFISSYCDRAHLPFEPPWGVASCLTALTSDDDSPTMWEGIFRLLST